MIFRAATPEKQLTGLAILDQTRLHEAETFLHEQIPLSRAMGLRVLPAGDDGFAVEAPVALNYNHLQTAFGGSINAVATLAGYALLWLELRALPAHVVISASSIRFLRPIRKTIRAVCESPSALRLEALRASLQETGKAKIHLQVRVEEHSIIAAHFEATFVALLPGKGGL
ncbi:MAG: thioesterase domain-containing protein [Verrucomicrobiota bacterium]|nr:thioesterase domain-containing protein [Verrucomicrobiota bacterium]